MAHVETACDINNSGCCNIYKSLRTAYGDVKQNSQGGPKEGYIPRHCFFRTFCILSHVTLNFEVWIGVKVTAHCRSEDNICTKFKMVIHQCIRKLQCGYEHVYSGL